MPTWLFLLPSAVIKLRNNQATSHLRFLFKMFHLHRIAVAMSTCCLHFRVKCKKNGVFFKNLTDAYCSTVEPPELPDWLISPKLETSDDSSLDDDFVLPSQCKSTPTPSVYEAGDSNSNSSTGIKIVPEEITDVDRVSNILRANFELPGSVVKGLTDCTVQVSKDLVDKTLKRFSNDWVSAFGFFLWADARNGYKHSPDSYDTMIDILGKMKQFDLMWGLLEEMVKAGGLVSLATMAKVMRRLAGAGKWNETLSTFYDLERFGVKRDTTSMNALLDTLCKERSVIRAKDAFLELRSEIAPNATTFNVLIHGWCKARKLEVARDTMFEMRDSGFIPCAITYTSLIEAYCFEKNFEMAYSTLEEMRANGCSPNVVTYTILMHSLGKANKTQEALQIFDQMKKEGCVPDTSFYNSLIYVLCKAGCMQDANNVYEEMCENGISPNVTTYNTLISAACRNPRREKALKLLVKMEENLCTPDIGTYTPLLKLCSEKRWTRILLYLLGHMFKRDVSLDLGTYTLLVQGLCRNKKLHESCMLFKEMALKGIIPKSHTYSQLLEALERENMDDAKAKIQQLMRHAETFRKTSNQPLDN